MRHARDRDPSGATRLRATRLDLISRRVARTIAANPRIALRLGEAADALGVSHDYFRKYIAPELRIVRVGRVQLVPVSELRRWIDEHASYATEG